MRLKLDPQTIQILYHETFKDHLERGKLRLLTEEELNDNEGNFITPLLVYEHDLSKTIVRTSCKLSLKTNLVNTYIRKCYLG